MKRIGGMLKMICFVFAIILLIFLFYRMKIKNMFVLPYTFFVLMIVIEFMGPLVYYYVLNGTAYRLFDNFSLNVFCCVFIVFLSTTIFITYLHSKNIVYRQRDIFFSKGIYRYDIFIFIILVFVGVYIFFNMKQFLIFRVTNNETANLYRSDTTGNLKHWFTVSNIINIFIPSFAIYSSYNKCRSDFIVYIYFLVGSAITLIDGNRGVFVYLIIFYIIFLKKYKITMSIFCSIFFAFFAFAVLGNRQLSDSLVWGSMFRRFFVTQGACFINRIYLHSIGYDFDNDIRISNQVFKFIYGYSIGSAPTVFWGDILCRYGYFFMFVILILTNYLIYCISEYIRKQHCEDYVLYWYYCYCIFAICFSEISISNVVRIMMAFIAGKIYLILTRKRKKLIKL